MSLPVVNAPIFEIVIPSLGETTTFRPFLVKEKKILLMAKNGTQAEQFRAIIDVLKSCFPDVNVESLPSFDIEYMFLKLRSKSIGEVTKLSYRCKNEIAEGETCNHVNEFEIKLDEVEIDGSLEKRKVIDVTEEIKLVLEYPSLIDIQKVIKFEDETRQIIGAMKATIESILDGDNILSLKDQTDDDIEKFLDQLPMSVINEIQDYIANAPKMKTSVEIKCEECGNVVNHEVEGLLNFF